MRPNCIMGNVGSNVFGASPISGTKIQDISASAALFWTTLLFFKTFFCSQCSTHNSFSTPPPSLETPLQCSFALACHPFSTQRADFPTDLPSFSRLTTSYNKAVRPYTQTNNSLQLPSCTQSQNWWFESFFAVAKMIGAIAPWWSLWRQRGIHLQGRVAYGKTERKKGAREENAYCQ